MGHRASDRHSSTGVSPTVVPIQPVRQIGEASGPAGASSEHDTRQLHAMAPGRVGQTRRLLA